MYNIGIIEDQDEIRYVLTDYFKQQEDMTVVVSAASYESYLEETQKNNLEASLDLIICDIGLPGRSGIEAILEIKSRVEEICIMMFTVFEEQNMIFQALCAGASGYLLKSTPLVKMKEAVLEIMKGGAIISPKMAIKVAGFFNHNFLKPPQHNKFAQKENLTHRELEILSLIQNGHTNREIAQMIFVSVDTVKYHIKNIYAKLHITCRKDLYIKYNIKQFK